MSYYDNDAISQSRLKLLCTHPSSFKNYKSASGPSLSLGSLVDSMLLTPKETKERFYILNKEINVSDDIKNIWNKYFEEREVLDNFDIDEDRVNTIAKDCKYRLTQDKARLKYVLEGKDYFNLLIESKGKTIINKDLNDRANEVVKSLKNNLFTKELFNLKKIETQVELYFELKKFPFKLKALLDFIIIDHKKKTIRPFDLKTTSEKTTYFKKSVYKYRYDFQAAFYTVALQIIYPDYKILPFCFVVENTIYPGSPLIYECTDSTLVIGALGGEVDGKKYKGFIECLEMLTWHTETNIWNYTKEEYENNGKVKL